MDLLCIRMRTTVTVTERKSDSDILIDECIPNWNMTDSDWLIFLHLPESQSVNQLGWQSANHCEPISVHNASTMGHAMTANRRGSSMRGNEWSIQ